MHTASAFSSMSFCMITRILEINTTRTRAPQPRQARAPGGGVCPHSGRSEAVPAHSEVVPGCRRAARPASRSPGLPPCSLAGILSVSRAVAGGVFGPNSSSSGGKAVTACDSESLPHPKPSRVLNTPPSHTPLQHPFGRFSKVSKETEVGGLHG